MTKTSKSIIGVLIIEAALAGYYFGAAPQCEPCLPGAPCPPCISGSQTIALWAGVCIAVAATGYFLFINSRRAKKDL